MNKPVKGKKPGNRRKGAVPKGMARGSSVSHKTRKKIRKITSISFVMVLLCLFLAALTPEEAGEHIGEAAVICGHIVSAEYKPDKPGKPTFLDFSVPYPANVFTVVIWGADRKKFDDAPEKAFLDRDVCVSGKITVYRKVPHIFISSPEQIGYMPEKKYMSAEEMEYNDLREYHEYFYKKTEIVALKTIFRALGYNITSMEERWTRDIQDAVFAFQDKNKVKKRSGKMTREMLLLLENNITNADNIKYKDKVRCFNLLQPLIARKPAGVKNYEDR